MHNSKLIDLLRSLDKKEVRLFSKFVNSPYFNSNERVAEFADYILKAAPEFENRRLKKEKAHAAFFPKQPFDDLQIRHLMSEVLHLLYDFLKIQSVQSQNVADIYLIKALRLKGNYRHFEGTYKFLSQKQEEDPIKDGDYFLHQYALEAEHAAYMAQKDKRIDEQGIQAVIQSLDKFYLLNKLKYGCALLSKGNIKAVTYDLFLLNDILKELESAKEATDPAIQIYYHILMTFRYPEKEAHFMSLKSLLSDHVHEVSNEEALQMYTHAQNYCVRRINQNDPRYLNEIFELYQFALQNGLMLQGGELLPWHYKNIITTGLRLKEYDWIYNFIHEYKTQLPEAYQENAYTYNLAQYHFYRNQHQKALTLLRQVEFDDVYALDARTMMLKIYYELKEMNALDSLLDSFSVYLRRRQEISAYHRSNYLSLIKYIKKLLSLPLEDTKRRKDLMDEVNSTKNITEKRWLLKKLKETA